MENGTKPRKRSPAHRHKTKEQGEAVGGSRTVPTRTAHEDACTAHHEAGHMVLAHAVGFRVIHVSLNRVVEAGSEGKMVIEAGRGTYPQLLAFTLAGHAAEAQYNPAHVIDPSQDMDWADAAGWLSRGMGYTVPKTHPYLWVLLEWTREVLAPAVSRIEAVAHHLLAVRTIDGESECHRVLAVDGPWQRKLLRLIDRMPTEVPAGFQVPSRRRPLPPDQPKGRRRRK